MLEGSTLGTLVELMVEAEILAALGPATTEELSRLREKLTT